MNFKHSLILKIDTHQNPLDSFVAWSNQNYQLNLSVTSVTNQPNITLVNQTGESIKIKTIREIKEQLSYSAYQATQLRFFVFLHADLITIPAQNALLKTIEEPPHNTQLLFVTANPEKLLDTIRSRCQLVTLPHGEKPKQANLLEIENRYFEIVTSTPGHKISIAAAYKDRADALLLCTQLVSFLHAELQNKTSKLTIKQITHNSTRLLETMSQLEKNVGVLLALENCFFELL